MQEYYFKLERLALIDTLGLVGGQDYKKLPANSLH